MPEPTARPTRQRFLVVLAAMLMSLLLYLDRNSLSVAEVYIRQGLNLTEGQMGWFFAAFYYSYALGQVPSGWLTDRFGSRKMLTLYILLWSAFTALTGLASGFVALIVYRIGFGLGQAGAYPTAGSMISKWVPFSARGTANAMVTMGGRVGGSLAPYVTALLIVMFVPVTIQSLLGSNDLLDLPRTAYEITLADRSEPDTELKGEDKLRAQVGQRILARLEPAAAEQLRSLGRAYAVALAANNAAAAKTGSKPQEPDAKLFADQVEAIRPEIVAAFNPLLTSPDLVDPVTFSAALPSFSLQAKSLLEEQQSLHEAGQQLDANEQTRLNRLALEAVYPGIRRIYGEGWRNVMYIYGAIGLLVALLFWWQVYDEPRVHPRVNAAEVALIEYGRPASVSTSQGHARGLPFKALLTSANMWLTSISQFTTNYAWVFLVTFLPRYLDEVHHVPIEQRGFLTAFPITVGWIGMLMGGPLTDRMTRRFGIRWGRALPMGLTRFMAMLGYLICMFDVLWASESAISSPWIAVAALSLVAFATDLGVPAVWAFQQDVAGRFVGSALGWGNMWGNFGAGVASNTLMLLVVYYGWEGMFGVAAGAFLLSGITALGIDARVPLVPSADEQP